jgi:hypothetical protein
MIAGVATVVAAAQAAVPAAAVVAARVVLAPEVVHVPGAAAVEVARRAGELLTLEVAARVAVALTVPLLVLLRHRHTHRVLPADGPLDVPVALDHPLSQEEGDPPVFLTVVALPGNRSIENKTWY